MLIIAGLYSDTGLGKSLFGNAVILYLGRISYSLYLTHIMIVVVLRQVLLAAPSVWVSIAVAGPPLSIIPSRSRSVGVAALCGRPVRRL